MADDQGKKFASIDDLVNELTKKSDSSPASSPAPVPKQDVSKPEIPKPRFTPPPLSATPRPVPVPAPVSRPQGQEEKGTAQQKGPDGTSPLVSTKGNIGTGTYQSSIRTMGEDIASIKSGQKPAGVDIPRKVAPLAPLPPIPPKSTTTPPPPMSSGPQFKMPPASLGQTEKATPLPREKMPVKPGEPQKPQIYVPPVPLEPRSNRLFLIIAGVAVIFGFLYWFLVLRAPSPEFVEQPTSTPTQTPTADLSELFPVALATIDVVSSNKDRSFNESVSSLDINGREFKRISVLDENDRNLKEILFPWPQQLSSSFIVTSIVESSFLLVYGQKEMFTSNGQIDLIAQPDARIVFMNEVGDPSFALQAAMAWEPTMANDLKIVFDFNLPSGTGFKDSSYQDVAIRYNNFPFADKSIDYAIVTAVNGKKYFVITNSRESMFAVIDVLRGLTTITPSSQ